MKKIIFLIITILNINNTYSQVRPDDPRWDNVSGNFEKENEIVSFFDKNIKSLDPIEGIYDVDLVARTGSLWAEDLYFHDSFYVVKTQHGINEYHVYTSNYSSLKRTPLWFSKIGDTNVYRATYNQYSSVQAYLENNVRLAFNIKLTSDDAKKFSMNPNFTNWIVLCYSMIKKYP